MRLTNSLETYGLVHQLLHWTTAALILFLLPLGVYMHELPIDTAAQVEWKVWLYSLHKTVGLTVLALAVLRVLWALVQPHPRLLNGGKEALAATTIHWLLYSAIIAMPLLGWIHHAASEGYAPIWWPFGQNLPLVPKDPAVSAFFGTAHFITGIVLVGSLLLHIAGAVKHAVIDKDQTLQRMVPGAYTESALAPAPKSGKRGALALAVGIVALAIAATFIVHRIKQASGHEHAPLQGAESLPRYPGEGWVIDRSASTFAITVQQLGSPVTGTFGEWDAQVFFDTAALDRSKIDATVAIASLSLSDVSQQAIGADYLNAAAHATATFVSDEVVATDSGYEAQGTLTLAGQAQPFTLPFTFREEDDRAFVEAEGMIDRQTFGVGTADTSSVGNEVGVTISIQAQRGQ
jgi:cytochrome b561/polyisoprenoid-binding protein YceI